MASPDQLHLLFENGDLEVLNGLPSVLLHRSISSSNLALYNFIQQVHSAATSPGAGAQLTFRPATQSAYSVCLQHSEAYWLVDPQGGCNDLKKLAKSHPFEHLEYGRGAIVCIIAVKGATFLTPAHAKSPCIQFKPNIITCIHRTFQSARGCKRRHLAIFSSWLRLCCGSHFA